MTKVDIPKELPYNPLEKKNIGESIVKAMLDSEKHALPPSKFIGAGVYALYYSGSNPIYQGLDSDTPIKEKTPRVNNSRYFFCIFVKK